MFHTILLTQPGPQVSSRVYYDFDTVAQAMDRIAGLYESFLQRENPGMHQIQYRAEDLLQFIDSYKEFVALVFEPSSQKYIPKDKEWLKTKLVEHLTRQQQRGSNPSSPSQQRQRFPNQHPPSYHRSPRSQSRSRYNNNW
ncbi:enhancer of rudimentary-domain-containing protein [Phascolomyces articulosus]|uniref:Enhancer of rudimentary-domain-containing protein n=1 Tax=Phascolomyces articulosus TaxID=60185 RepID=A0AAD5K8H3_9FUNG|nr:enhancer of rudimentary-domain-containing protein [Phascolomyces articulosus]